MKKQALVVANLAGFSAFLLHDMKLLMQMGYDVTYAANANKLEWVDTHEKLNAMGVQFIQIDFDSQNPFAKANRVAYRQLKSLFKEHQYDLVHCHTPIAGLLTRLAARSMRRRGCRVIYTTHGFAFTSYSSRLAHFAYYHLEKWCSKFCDAIITINREDYAAAKTMRCKNVFYINGVGVDTRRFHSVFVDRDAYRAKIGVSAKSIMILSVGELSKRKNHRLIIEALSLMPDKNRYEYVICGNGIDGGTGQELTALANKLSVNMRLLGFRSDIPEITAISDIGALPSLREGLGFAGVQSLAAGNPVVGTDVQGIRDYIVNGKTGYLCPPEPQAFADAIERLLRERESMRDNCRAMAEKFDKTVSFAQMENIYQELLSANA